MRRRVSLLLALAALGAAGCGAHDDREWMKTTQRYTKEEFQRDHRECSRKGDLDESCMRQRGWVPVNPARSEPQRPDPLQRGPRY